MREASVTRVSADVCFFFLLFTLFSPVAPRGWVCAAFLAACTIFGLLAIRPEKALLRLLAMLPPLLLLLAAPDGATRIALGVAWLYAALLFTLDRAGMEYWVYRKCFLVMAIPSVAACLMVFASAVFHIAAPISVYTYAAVFILLGLHTLRAMRMGVSTDTGWKLYSILELLLPVVLAGLIGAGLSLLLRHAGVLVELLALPLGLLVLLINNLFSAIFPDFNIDPMTVDEVVSQEHFDSPASDPTVMSEEAAEVSGWLNTHSIPWTGIAIALLCVAALVLLALYLRRSRRAKNAVSAMLREQRFQLFEKILQKPRARNNAERIRGIYREYLDLLQLHGREIRASDTSLDIAPDGSADECRLRQLYLVARYGDGDSLSASDVSAAQDCLERIREAT